MPSLEPTQILIVLVMFVIVIFILKYLFFKPILKVMKKRSDLLDEKFNEANVYLEQAKELENQKIEELKQMKDSLRQFYKEAIDEAETLRRKIVADAKNDARVMMEKANFEIKKEREKNMMYHKMDIIQVAVKMSESILSEAMTEQQHMKFIDAFIENFDDYVN